MAEMPQTLDLQENQVSPFSLLPYDIIQDLCHRVSEVERNKKGPHPLDGFSRAARFLRDVSLPLLLRSITVKGDWNHAFTRFNEIEGCPAAFELVR